MVELPAHWVCRTVLSHQDHRRVKCLVFKGLSALIVRLRTRRLLHIHHWKGNFRVALGGSPGRRSFSETYLDGTPNLSLTWVTRHRSLLGLDSTHRQLVFEKLLAIQFRNFFYLSICLFFARVAALLILQCLNMRRPSLGDTAPPS